LAEALALKEQENKELLHICEQLMASVQCDGPAVNL